MDARLKDPGLTCFATGFSPYTQVFGLTTNNGAPVVDHVASWAQMRVAVSLFAELLPSGCLSRPEHLPKVIVHRKCFRLDPGD